MKKIGDPWQKLETVESAKHCINEMWGHSIPRCLCTLRNICITEEPLSIVRGAERYCSCILGDIGITKEPLPITHGVEHYCSCILGC